MIKVITNNKGRQSLFQEDNNDNGGPNNGQVRSRAPSTGIVSSRLTANNRNNFDEMFGVDALILRTQQAMDVLY